MKKGYLIFTTLDGNGIETIFTEDREIFKKLLIARTLKTNREVLNIWDEYIDPDNNKKFERNNRFSIEALGDSTKPFDNIKILGTFYMDAY